MRRNNLIVFFVFFSLGVLIYFNSLQGEFVLDDGRIIVKNIFITNFKYISLYFQGKISSASPEQMFFRPLWMLSYNINYFLAKHRVWMYHLSNVIIHILNGFLLYLLLCLFFPETDNKIKILTATIFIVHPVNSEAVNYISARSDILCASFILASLYHFFKWDLAGRRNNLIWSYTFMLLGCLTKEFAFALPVFILGYLFITNKWRKYKFYALPFFLIMILFVFGYWLVSGRKVGWNNPLYFVHNFLVQAKVALFYLRLFMLPYGLTIVHEITPFSYWGGLGELGVIFAVFFLASKYKNSRFLLGIIFFIIFMVPKLVKLNLPGMEHHFYIPQIGLYISLISVLNKLNIKKALFILTGVIFIFSTLTVSRNRVWRNGESLWLDALRKNPYSEYILTSLGLKYLRENKTDLAQRYLFKALKECREIKKLTQIAKGIAEIYRRKGDLNKAEQILYALVKFYPQNVELLHNLGVIYAQQGKYKKAEQYYIMVLKINPYYLNSIFNLGLLYLKEGRILDARKLFYRCVELHHDFGRGYFYLGLISEQEENFDQAISWYKKAVETAPEYWGGYLGLGSIYARVGDDRAEFYLQKAAELNPDLPEVWYNLGLFYLYGHKNLEKARKCFRRVQKMGYKLPEYTVQILK
jgi:tetratricopeptide (TPR) repeat protein